MSEISVTYFDPLNIFENVRHEIDKYFPLHNIHYKRFPEENVSTIKNLDIKIKSDDKVKDGNVFFSNLIITCKTIEEYRKKIRPLIHQWLSSTTAETLTYDLGIVFVQTTSEDISDNKFFNSLNLLEKIEKDFPTIKPENILQVPIFYKSVQDKNNFYASFLLKLQKQVLNSLNIKLKSFEILEDDIYRTSKFIDLYLRFGIVEYSSVYLDYFTKNYISNPEFLVNLLPGSLNVIDIDLFVTSNKVPLLKKDTVTYIDVLNFRLLSVLKLLFLKHQPLLNDDIALLHKTIIDDYLMQVERIFVNDKGLDKFIYLMIEEFFMKLPLILLNLSPDNTVTEANKKEWNLFLGKLATIKRQSWINMVDSSAVLKFKLNDNPLKAQMSGLNVIENLHSSEDEILDHFITLTQNAISYWKDLKPITVDLLSSDIAIVFNKFGQHEKTIAILHSTFEYYYNIMKWEDLSIQLLEIYSASLEKLYQKDNLAKIIDDDELVPIVTVLANSYLNFICLMKNNDKCYRSLNRKMETWNKFLKLNENTDLIYPLSRLIDLNVGLVSNLEYDISKKCHYYYINVTWDWLIDSQIILNLNLVKLKMRNLDSDEILVFEAYNAKLTDKNNLILRCYDVSFGKFELVSLELFLSDNNTIFIKEFEERLIMNILNLFHPEKFELTIGESSEYEDEAISLDISYCNFNAKDTLAVSLQILEPAFLVFKENGEPRISFTEKDMRSVLKFELNDKNIEFTPNIGFVFKLKTTLNESFKETRIVSTQFTNPLLISPALIPKESATYLTITVDSAFEPFNIISTSLLERHLKNESEANIVKTELDSEIKNIVLPNNPLSNFRNFFKLREVENLNFVYELQYMTLLSSIRGYLTKRFLDEFEHLSLYKKVWVGNILPKLQFHINQFIHFKTIKLNVYDEVEFRSFLESFVASTDTLNNVFINTLMCIYRKLFDGIQLNKDDSIWEFGKLQTFHKSLCFEDKQVGTLFTISLQKTFKETNLKMGDCYKYSLKINKKHNYPSNKSGAVYECIILDEKEQNDWLVGGFNKFYVDENSGSEVFEINLIPIKRGYLKYPHIRVRMCDEKESEAVSCFYKSDFVNVNENIIII